MMPLFFVAVVDTEQKSRKHYVINTAFRERYLFLVFVLIQPLTPEAENSGLLCARVSSAIVTYGKRFFMYQTRTCWKQSHATHLNTAPMRQASP